MSEQADAIPPKVFISYSWDSPVHKAWVKDLATRLRADGIDVTLDQWAAAPGDQLPKFMETAIRDNSYVVIICTPNYKKKSDERKGGVGYEGDIMTGEVFASANHRKFIPCLRGGEWGTAIPSWLTGKYAIDLSGEPYLEAQYKDLLATLHNIRDQAPPIGAAPIKPKSIREAAKEFSRTSETGTGPFEPVRITGVLADEATAPPNDGTRGSALYAIPFQLNRTPTHEWGDLFVRIWDQPPQFTLRHRPGIARVQGNRIVLTRTTMEEVRDVHRETLKLVVDATNQEIERRVDKRRSEESEKANRERAHQENLRRIAGEVKFD